MVESFRDGDDSEEIVVHDTPAPADGDAFLNLSVHRGPLAPFDFDLTVQTDDASAQVGHEPTWGPREVPVPGADRAAATSWLWTGGEPSAPRRTLHTLVEVDPGLHLFFQVGGSQACWPEETVDTFLDSLTAAEQRA